MFTAIFFVTGEKSADIHICFRGNKGALIVYEMSITRIRALSGHMVYAHSKTTWQASSWCLQTTDPGSALTPTPRIPMLFNSKVWVKARLAS